MAGKPEGPGRVLWHDLTVDDADGLRDFYAEVVGWRARAENMGDYSDYSMVPPDSVEPAAGVCHRRGPNAEIPAQWLMYITVADLDNSIARCRELGGEVIGAPRSFGADRYCVIRDPAGAVCALYQAGRGEDEPS